MKLIKDKGSFESALRGRILFDLQRPIAGGLGLTIPGAVQHLVVEATVEDDLFIEEHGVYLVKVFCRYAYGTVTAGYRTVAVRQHVPDFAREDHVIDVVAGWFVREVTAGALVTAIKEYPEVLEKASEAGQ